MEIPFISVLVGHWLLAVFCQSFFLHRYASHAAFALPPLVERGFYWLTYLAQGPSFLVPRAYAALHHEHHLYSDTPDDPHSPQHCRSLLAMMLRTVHRYEAFVERKVPMPASFTNRVVECKILDRWGDSWASRIVMGSLYIAFYVAFAPHFAYFLLLPVHFMLGPIHGAIVNWCGHRYGYRNYAIGDHSHNVLPWDLVTLGELFQNNHHRAPLRANFGHRWFEVDPTYVVIWSMSKVGMLAMRRQSANERHRSGDHVSPLNGTTNAASQVRGT